MASLNAFCLDGEGKGRIKFKNNKYLFRYESLIDIGKKNWKLAFDIPIHGEEMIDLTWNDEDELRVDGSFYSRLLGQTRVMEKGAYYRGLLNKFLFFSVYMAKLSRIEEDKIQCENQSCTALNKSWTWSQKGSTFSLLHKLDDRHTLIAEGFGDDAKHFSKLTFSVELAENFRTDQRPLALSLFTADCER